MSAARMLFSLMLFSLQIFLISLTIWLFVSQYLLAIDHRESPNSTVYVILWVSSLTAITVSVVVVSFISSFLPNVHPVKLVNVIVPASIRDAALTVFCLS